MRLTLPTETLQKALQRISVLPGGRGGTPFSVAVKLEADITGFKMTRQTPEAEIVIQIEDGVSLENEGTATLDHRELSTLLSRVSGKEIKLFADEKNLNLEFGKGAKAKIGLFTEDFDVEPMEDVKALHSFKMDLGDLESYLAYTVQAASTEQARPGLVGVRLQKMEGRFSFIGADGRRSNIFITKIKTDMACTIPTESVEAIRKAIAGEVGKVTLSTLPNPEGEASSLKVETTNIAMRLPLLAEKYPDVSAMVKVKDEDLITATFNREDLAEALQMATPIGDGDYKAIEVDVSKTAGTLRAANAISSAEIPLGAKSPKSFSFRLSGEYLKQAMAWFQAEKESVPISLWTASKAIVMREPDRVSAMALQVPSTTAV